jgi:hypothetical protein
MSSGDLYEARVVVVLSRLEKFKKRVTNEKGRGTARISRSRTCIENTGHLDAVRYVRHGGYYSNWWCQTRRW